MRERERRINDQIMNYLSSFSLIVLYTPPSQILFINFFHNSLSISSCSPLLSFETREIPLPRNRKYTSHNYSILATVVTIYTLSLLPLFFLHLQHHLCYFQRMALPSILFIVFLLSMFLAYFISLIIHMI